MVYLKNVFNPRKTGISAYEVVCILKNNSSLLISKTQAFWNEPKKKWPYLRLHSIHAFGTVKDIVSLIWPGLPLDSNLNADTSMLGNSKNSSSADPSPDSSLTSQLFSPSSTIFTLQSIKSGYRSSPQISVFKSCWAVHKVGLIRAAKKFWKRNLKNKGLEFEKYKFVQSYFLENSIFFLIWQSRKKIGAFFNFVGF